MEDKFKNLKRPRYPMLSFIEDALNDNNLMNEYKERPAYQQNDYIGWITIAVREETKQKRLNQMIEELKDGGLYMKMKYKR
ncbi:MAG: YdeI/OmpD-associated family protein [Spirochaetota bacterium]|nr:YdeI/OmpD-associated family protein [Spirochaetota bacterium]